MILAWLTATWPKQKWLCSLLVRLWFWYDPQHQRYWLLLILPLLSDYLLPYSVSELEILSLVPFTRLFSAQPEQRKSTVVETRIADNKSLRKNPVEKKRRNKCQMFKQNLLMPHPFEEIAQEQLIHMKIWHIIPPRSVGLLDLLKKSCPWSTSVIVSEKRELHWHN